MLSHVLHFLQFISRSKFLHNTKLICFLSILEVNSINLFFMSQFLLKMQELFGDSNLLKFNKPLFKTWIDFILAEEFSNVRSSETRQPCCIQLWLYLSKTALHFPSSHFICPSHVDLIILQRSTCFLCFNINNTEKEWDAPVCVHAALTSMEEVGIGHQNVSESHELGVRKKWEKREEKKLHQMTGKHGQTSGARKMQVFGSFCRPGVSLLCVLSSI